jgi:type I restriction enzyme, S subunit
MMPTVNAVFLEHFDHLLATPDSVERLNQAILDLAVRGKLVSQDPTDEPASELVKRLNSEPRPPVQDDEKLFDLPAGWEWVRLGSIISLEYGDGLPKAKRADEGNVPVYGSNGVVGYHTEFLIDKPCIVVGRKGSSGAVNFASERCWVIDTAYYVIPPDGISIKFLFHLLKSLRLDNLGKGIKPGLNRNEAYSLVVALPPTNEQHRIVARVEQLFAQTRRLAELLSKAQTDLTHLNEAALHHLLAADTPADFNARWNFIAEHFDLLYSEPEHVAPLRQAVLELAVRGKLTRQDSTDEPASELLKRIRIEKARMVEAGEVRESDPLPAVDEEETPFQLPDGWMWTRIGAVSTVKGGKRVPKGDALLESPTEHVYIRVTDMKNGTIIDQDLRYISDEVFKSIEKYIIEKTDLYITIAGTIGAVGSVPEKFHGMNLTENAARITPFVLDREYLKIALSSPVVQTQFLDKVNQMAQPKLALVRIKTTIIPLPPFAEQQRIVARVEQLLGLCDALAAKLQAAQVERERLVEAVVAGVAGKMAIS